MFHSFVSQNDNTHQLQSAQYLETAALLFLSLNTCVLHVRDNTHQWRSAELWDSLYLWGDCEVFSKSLSWRCLVNKFDIFSNPKKFFIILFQTLDIGSAVEKELSYGISSNQDHKYKQYVWLKLLRNYHFHLLPNTSINAFNNGQAISKWFS